MLVSPGCGRNLEGFRVQPLPSVSLCRGKKGVPGQHCPEGLQPWRASTEPSQHSCPSVPSQGGRWPVLGCPARRVPGPLLPGSHELHPRGLPRQPPLLLLQPQHVWRLWSRPSAPGQGSLWATACPALPTQASLLHLLKPGSRRGAQPGTAQEAEAQRRQATHQAPAQQGGSTARVRLLLAPPDPYSTVAPLSPGK